MKTLLKRERPGLRRIAALMLVVVLSCIGTKAFAEDTFTVGGIKYEFVDKNAKTVKVSEWNSCTGEITIPASFYYDSDDTEYTVTEIGDYAFARCSDLTKVTIPNSVTKIGNTAFYQTGLTSIEIPNSVTEIEFMACHSCAKLETVTIGSSVTKVSDHVFAGCSALQTVTMLNTTPPTHGDGVFDECSNLTAIYVPSGSGSSYNSSWSSYASKIQEIVEVTVGDLKYKAVGGKATVTGLANGASPSTLTIPETITYDGATYDVTTIDKEVFYNCGSLTSVSIPSSVTSIGEYAFGMCSALTRVTVLNTTPPTLGDNVFLGSGNLTAIYVPSANVDTYKSSWSSYADKIQEIEDTERDEYGFKAKNSDGVRIYYLYTNDDKTEARVGRNYCAVETINIPATAYDGTKDVKVTSISTSAFENNSTIKTVNIAEGVTSIGVAAFASCEKLTEVTIPSSVTSIGDYAFAYCKKLTEVTIPSSVKSIGDNAFNGCSGLTSVTIPSSVTEIKESAFYGCQSLTTVTIEGTGLKTIGEEAFFQCYALESVNIPSSVTKIESRAFCKCEKLASTVTIPGGVTSIGQMAFEGCEKLSAIVIEEGVKEIGLVAFEGCSGLTSVTIPSSVTNIGAGAFQNCESLTEVTIPSSVTTIEGMAFNACSKLAKVTMLGSIPPALTAYEGSTTAFFDECATGLEIYVPAGSGETYKAATNWTAYADKIKESEAATKEVTEGGLNYTVTGGKATVTGFASDASGTSTLTIPATIEDGKTTVTGIGAGAFVGCTTLTSVTVLATEPITVGADAFSGCSNLMTIYVPDGKVDAYRAADGWSGFKYIVSSTDEGLTVNDGSLTITYQYTDENRNALKVVSGTNKYTGTVTIPAEIGGLPVTSIGGYAFNGCEGLTEVTIPSSVTSIGKGAFQGCAGLTSIEIPSGVTSIGVAAFAGCSKLTSIEIPSGVTSIGDGAFLACMGLTEVTIGEKVTSIGNNAFQSCTDLTSVTIPSSVTSIGVAAFSYCKKLTEVTIPSSVTSIGEGAFGDCTALTKVTSNIQTPFTIASSVFDSSVESTATLYVPAWTQSAYKAAEGWKEFTNIEELADASERKTTDGGLKFTIANKKATVTGFASDASDKTTLTIPATVTYSGTACSVTGIGEGAFKDCTTLTSVTVLATEPLTVGANAFSGCSNLETLYVPNDEAVSKYRAAEGWKDIKYIATTTDDGLKVNDGSVTITYKYTDGKQALEVVNVDPAKGDITIPAEIGGLPVTTIGDGAFQGCTDLTSVTIKGNNLKTIGAEAFRKCTGLKTVNIPSSVTSIGNKAFCECEALEGTVTIPSGVTVIGESVFGGCKKLTGVTIPEGVTSIGVMAFYGTSLTEVTIPSSVTTVGDGAFGYCSSLSTITIPSGVTTIGEAAFANCEALTSVTIPSSVTSIGEAAFYGCTALTKVTSNIEKPFEISDDVFDEDVEKSATLVVPKGTKEAYAAADGWKEFTTIDDGTTGDGDGDGDNDGDDSILTYKQVNGGLEVSGITSGYSGSIVIPETASINGGDAQNVISIGASAFKDCTGLTSVTIPSSVTKIDAYAFAGCTGIKNITALTTTPPSLGDDVFESTVKANATLKVPADTKVKYAAADGWKAFARIVEDKTGPDYIEEEEDGTVINFNYNTGDTGDKTEWYVTKGNYTGTVTIPEKVGDLPVTGIESDAFAGCTALEAVEIPRSVTTIGDGAFDGCSALKTVTIHSTVTTIGAGAFDGCTTLKKVIAEDIPAWCSINFGSETANPLVQAGHIYSDENTEITDLVISERVKTISAHAFSGGIGLRSVTIGNNNTKSGLKSDLKVEEYYDGVKEIGDSAFYGCSNLISVTLRNSVETIGAYAFNDCNMLDSVAIPSGVKAIGEKAFYCSDISTVVSHIEEPYAIEASAFSEYTLNDGTLYVPDETLTKYKSTAGWKEFKHIVGKMSTGIEDINADKVTIRANGGALHIDGVKDGTRVVVYSLTGAMIGSGNVAGGTVTIPTGLSRGDIAIVRIGSTSVKVMVQ